jgi:3-carboxy-cis,cis-muconate cycloisomerase
MLAARPYPAPLAGLFGDPEVAGALSVEAQIAAMLRVEAALAAAQAELGVVPPAAAEAVAALNPKMVDLDALDRATARDGVAVPGLVAQWRAALSGDHAPYLHWGATSQDIVDTAAMLCLRAAVDIMAARLSDLMDALAALADAHRGTVMAARTRGQPAVPTTFGLKAAGWLMPLIRHAERLPPVRDGLPVSLGGAGGTNAAIGTHAGEVERRMAARLGLCVAPMPWHAQRDGLVALGAWMAAVSGSLGKLGTDVLLLAQAEVGELALAGAGGSSTMPNKANPTVAEALVVLARRVGRLMGDLQDAPLHAHERDGVAWQGEWLIVPDLAQAAGASLLRAQTLLERLEVRSARMRASVEASNGLLAAEAAAFRLAAVMPRPEAQALVKRACAEVTESGVHLADVLAQLAPEAGDLGDLHDPAALVGDSDAMVERVLAARADLAER